ncbi:AraC family transcriptional regulator [Gemmatimonas groenlandica]|uniref:AraC family transcriptional regulator n=2 Tax=Gemmatimonas groenlandica TaxID=2732249 RepID=A0A6M4INU7_9BACT|nr:AraC family transcriptional regulator [Gemmatimonas groenlandica]QJR36410.1 AraC family transcriptional regulator [Gemmatimonas groenlandica]
MHLRAAFASAARAGVEQSALLEASGITPEQMLSPEAPVALESALRLWDEAARRSGDPWFGLHAGELADPLRFGALGYVIMSSGTVREALDAAIRYERVMYTGFRTTLEQQAENVIIGHAAVTEDIPVERHPIEFALATILTVCRRTSERPVRARAVLLRHRAHGDTAEYERVFGVRPTFGAEKNALILPASALAFPVRGASPDVLRSIAPIVEKLHADVLGDAPVTDAVRRAVATAVHHAEPTLAMIASTLVMSERSLQRRLADEQTSFQRVLDDTRQALTLQYLEDPSLPIGEVAFLTGFRDGSAFHRAVRRWTGRTPGQIRAERDGA